MPRRTDSLQTLCDFTRGAGGGLVYLTIAELEGLLAVVEAARHLRDNCDVYGGNPHIVIPAAVALDKAIAKLDEVQP